MPTQFASPFVERIFVIPQAAGAFNLVTNVAGVATMTNAKMLRMGGGTKLKADPALIISPVKTGTRSMQPGIAGRKSNNTFSLPSLPIIPSGTAGTPPDQDLLFQGIFGQAPTGSAYTMLDGAIITFNLARFQHLQTTLSQQFAIGCIVSDWSININADILMMSINGQCYWVLDSENFAAEDTAGKGGLTAFPIEVVTPTVVGTIQQGFTGTATFDGTGVDSTTFPLISASIKGRTGNDYSHDVFGTSYGALPAGGRRMISTSVTFQETDVAALNNLKVKAKAKTPLNITYVINGGGAGNITTIALKGVQLAVPEYSDEAARVVTAFSESQASASTISAVDELAITFS
jgi:hypothetical protein